MGPDSPPATTVDPNLATEEKEAQANLVKSLQTETSQDSASLMARYGTRLAMSGTIGGSPLASSSTAKV